jgi:hypothetical protein
MLGKKKYTPPDLNLSGILIKNGKILNQIPYNKDNLLRQITQDLNDFFNVKIDLPIINHNNADIFSSYNQIYTQYKSNTIKKLKDKFTTTTTTTTTTKKKLKDKFTTTTTTTTLTFTDFFTNKSESFTLIPSKEILQGGFNKINKYQSNTTKLLYIFRESNNKSEDDFNCFYENLKHLILYIIMCRYNNKKKIIPKLS